jgi:hypothetical protein
MWQRYIDMTLKLSKKYKIGCIIDVGALLAGAEPIDIVKFLNQHENFNQ